jgi:hypothetical protein
MLSMVQTPQQQDMDSCAHVESCLAAAEAAECPLDWRNFLVQYVTLLATQSDTARLDALCASLLGPLSWSPTSTQATLEGNTSCGPGGVGFNSAANAVHASYHRQHQHSGTGCGAQGNNSFHLAVQRLAVETSVSARNVPCLAEFVCTHVAAIQATGSIKQMRFDIAAASSLAVSGCWTPVLLLCEALLHLESLVAVHVSVVPCFTFLVD